MLVLLGKDDLIRSYSTRHETADEPLYLQPLAWIQQGAPVINTDANDSQWVNPPFHTFERSTIRQPLLSEYGEGRSILISTNKPSSMPFSENPLRSPARRDAHQRTDNGLQDHNANRENLRSSPRKPVEVYEDDFKRPSMHKKTKSAVSLMSLIGNDKVKTPKLSRQESEDGIKLKRPKSSTGLSALLSRSRAPKETRSDHKSPIKDKENRTPPQTADIVPPPIWAQFATQSTSEPRKSVTVPQATRIEVEKEIALYTPKEYSPSKQRNFHDYRPTLSRKPEPSPRPLSKFMSPGNTKHGTGTSVAATQQQPRMEQERRFPMEESGAEDRGSDDTNKRLHAENGSPELSNSIAPSAVAKVKQSSRVMAAVAAFDGIPDGGCDTKPPKPLPSDLYTQNIESEFETLLDTRNIPHNVRDKMRSLTTDIKIDFIRKEKSASGSVSSTESRTMAFPRDASRKRPNSNDLSSEERSVSQTDEELADKTDNEGSPKKRRSRPRSRTFTFSRGESSPKKKEKSERSKSRGRSKSRDRAPEEVERVETPEGRSRSFSFSRAPKPAVPDDFVSYLRKTQKPQEVEVGKLQKLRQLLRNETVVWVDAFINQGGMAEVIALLDRILKVEWREEHEDTLLHETLLCLKAMCTTSVALDQLAQKAPTLFPTLLAMLFDEQRKGPSEFATRNVVMSLLFIHLTAASSAQYETRARDILGYLHDQSKPEDSRPPEFIAQMHSPRPYHIWCNELVNVTKEVFWIFLHHINVIPYPQLPTTPNTSTNEKESYKSTHFPPERPPIPAAPYIGGVEWDATNYLATHIDLLNGLLACLPTRDERNHLRQQLKDSGFEKCMGVSLRTCKEKWYGYVHLSLSTWVGAAAADGWSVREVREGPRRDETRCVMASPKKNGKGKGEEAPRLEMPKLSLGIGRGGGDGKGDEGGWL
ncbi:MAG: hypothetical protein Q9168_005033 [Polycauliona sp. 1 TL-2023]